MKKVTSGYRIRIDDINYGGHMGNDRALAFFNDARVRFLKYFGYDELNIGEDTGIIIYEAHVKYQKEVVLHDEIAIDVWVSETEGLKWTLSYRAVRLTDNQVVFSGTTKMLCFNYTTRKVVPVPEEFLKKVAV